MHVKGMFVSRGLRHGHTFLQLSDIRGYENLIFDMADEGVRLTKLIAGIEEFNMAIVNRYIALGADQITYAEDLGMQSGPMLSPAHFRKYIKSVYKRLMEPALKSGRIVHMHSDGDIRLLVDDIVDDGVKVINLQIWSMVSIGSATNSKDGLRWNWILTAGALLRLERPMK